MHRARPEVEYASLNSKYGMGMAAFSPLALGVLTGKYNERIAANTRLDTYRDYFRDTIHGMHHEEDMRIVKVRELEEYAREKLDCSVTQLALAWLAAQNLTSTIILGASKPEQILDNVSALEVIPKITPEVNRDILRIMDLWDPSPAPRYRDDPMPAGQLMPL
ncbi:Aldo/keto reductase [Exidia glandulosa HHB12029]|nr:Aldo/keto reductase [Exidia glandulosa HHB12029]